MSLRTICQGLAVALIIALAIGGYYIYGVYYPSTDDAYVGTNLLDVASKTDGFIQNIYVENNQFVKKGQLLLEISSKIDMVNLNKAENDKQYAYAQLNAAAKSVQIAGGNLNKANNDYSLAKQLATRYTNLYKTGSGSLQDKEMYQTKSNAALENVRQEEASLARANEQYKSSAAQLASAGNNIQAAQIQAGYTKIYAPVDGYVSNFNLVIGQLIKAEEPIFGLIDSSRWWVDANFKETQLTRVRVGQSVDVKLDMYRHTYHGIVKSISYSSGNTFALLPSENATGNWVKVTQRFSVRIQLQNNDHEFPLRVGASSNVTINTRSRG